MVARTPIDLFFGDTKLTIRPLTIGQLEDLEELFAQEGATRGGMKLARQAIKIALSRDHGDRQVEDLECDVQELPKHLQAIMELGGFVPSGETPAAAGPNASTGELSAVE